MDVPQVKGIENIGAANLSVRIETKVAPGAHYDVKRTLHRMLIEAFHAPQAGDPLPEGGRDPVRPSGQVKDEVS
jgi:small conductance mechanosensitive channel